MSLLDGELCCVVYQDDTNIPSTGTPECRGHRRGLIENTPLSLEGKLGVNDESQAENRGVSCEKKNVCGGQIVAVTLDVSTMSTYCSPIFHGGERGMRFPAQRIQRCVDIAKGKSVISLPRALTIHAGWRWGPWWATGPEVSMVNSWKPLHDKTNGKWLILLLITLVDSSIFFKGLKIPRSPRFMKKVM